MIVIFGLPGAGKTTTAREIAKLRSLVLLETDLLHHSLSELESLPDAERYKVAFHDICSIIEENKHFQDRFIVAGAMPHIWQWDLLMSVKSATTTITPVFLKCELALCVERLDKRQWREENARAVHSYKSLKAISDLYDTLSNDFFANSVDTNRPSESVVTKVEGYLNDR